MHTNNVLPSSKPYEIAQGFDSKNITLVTGICGRLGRRLCRALHRETSVVGVDRRDFVDKPKDVIHTQVDLRRKKIKDVFRSMNIDAVVHLGVMHNPRVSATEHHAWNVVAFNKLLDYVAQFGVKKLVVLSSANVYGPQPDNPQFLTEDAPLLAAARFGDMRDLIEVDMLAQRFFWKHPNTETVVLRPVHILGTVHNAPSNYLRLNPVPTLLGYDPMIQVIHEADVVRAIQLALQPKIRGIFNLAGPEPLPLSRAIKLLGRARLPVPSLFFRAALQQMWTLRLSNFPDPELDYIKYVCMVDSKRAKSELGFQHRFGLVETLKSIL